MATKTENRKLVNAWIDPDDAERVDDVARAADRSRSAELRLAIRAYLERADDKNAGSRSPIAANTAQRTAPSVGP